MGEKGGRERWMEGGIAGKGGRGMYRIKEEKKGGMNDRRE